MQDVTQFVETYYEQGFVGNVPILSDKEINYHYAKLLEAEERLGSMHYQSKAHTIMTSAYELATHPALLQAIEAIIGPDILLYNVTYIIKEPHSEARVSWHQDLTYWGFDFSKANKQVSAWLALSDATPENGCMMMIPNSHKDGLKQHHNLHEKDNILLQGQTVYDVNMNDMVYCPLKAGETSLHHGYTLHSSAPNKSGNRRVGLNIQYITPDLKQEKDNDDTAMLVRGEDKYHYYKNDLPAVVDFEEAALEKQRKLYDKHREIAGTT